MPLAPRQVAFSAVNLVIAMSELLRFQSELHDTILWCTSRVDSSKPQSCLRSESLRPKALDKNDGDLLNSVYIAELVRARKALLADTSTSKADMAGQVSGRILASAYEYTNHNALVQGETKGYFDYYDNPPWDTWVCEIQGAEGPNPESGFGSSSLPTIETARSGEPPAWKILVSWVPAEFKAVVNHAIETECMGMLTWCHLPGRSDGTLTTLEEVLPTWLVEFSRAKYG